MWHEHFGIGVVEMLAAGLVTVAHDSAGPQMDIVNPALPIVDGDGDDNEVDDGQREVAERTSGVGFLAHDAASYAAALARALRLSPEARRELVVAAQQHSLKFSDGVFADHFARLVTGPKHGNLFGSTSIPVQGLAESGRRNERD